MPDDKGNFNFLKKCQTHAQVRRRVFIMGGILILFFLSTYFYHGADGPFSFFFTTVFIAFVLYLYYCASVYLIETKRRARAWRLVLFKLNHYLLHALKDDFTRMDEIEQETHDDLRILMRLRDERWTSPPFLQFFAHSL